MGSPRRMCDAVTLVEMISACQTSAAGAAGRIIADGLACQQHT